MRSSSTHACGAGPDERVEAMLISIGQLLRRTVVLRSFVEISAAPGFRLGRGHVQDLLKVKGEELKQLQKRTRLLMQLATVHLLGSVITAGGCVLPLMVFKYY